MSACALREAYAEGRLSPLEATRAVLARIEALNPLLNAFCLVDVEAALADARASEARWRAGRPLGALDGVPVSIKDLILTRGWPTLRGSLTVDPIGPWREDAPAVARLREAGAVLLGKTCTPEFGWRGSTDSPLTGITRNPWDPATTPGGSSGGATAAVAAGLGPLGVGTDGGGSVRIPAAFTGTVGLKPHFGRVPAWPASPMGSVSHVGPQARTVADAAALLDVLARPDPRDWTALPPPGPQWLETVAPAGERPLAGLRIAYSPRLGVVPWVDPRIEAAVARAAARLAELGATLEAVDPGLPDLSHAFRVHWFASARQFLHRLPEPALACLDPGLRSVVEAAAAYTLVDYLDAQAQRAQAAMRMRAFAADWDLLLTPATAVLPFAVGEVAPPMPDGRDAAHDWTWWTPFSYPFNLTQQPAIVVPCGFADDLDRPLPIALQLVAPAWREDLCLRAAAAYEASEPWASRRPPVG